MSHLNMNINITLKKQINLTVEYGDKVAIIGPSGSGKSTLLQVLLGLYQIGEGEVRLKGKDMNSINDNENIKHLMQCYNLNIFLMVQFVIIYFLSNQMITSKGSRRCWIRIFKFR